MRHTKLKTAFAHCHIKYKFPEKNVCALEVNGRKNRIFQENNTEKKLKL